jgi:hypothetical protein
MNIPIPLAIKNEPDRANSIFSAYSIKMIDISIKNPLKTPIAI